MPYLVLFVRADYKQHVLHYYICNTHSHLNRLIQLFVCHSLLCSLHPPPLSARCIVIPMHDGAKPGLALSAAGYPGLLIMLRNRPGCGGICARRSIARLSSLDRYPTSLVDSSLRVVNKSSSQNVFPKLRIHGSVSSDDPNNNHHSIFHRAGVASPPFLDQRLSFKNPEC